MKPATKNCSNCKRDLHPICFPGKPSSPDELDDVCRECLEKGSQSHKRKDGYRAVYLLGV